MKSKSRRELKDRIKQLKSECACRSIELEAQREEYKKLKERFRALGSDPEAESAEGVPFIEAEIKPEPWGNCVRLRDDLPFDEQKLQEELVKSMVRGLIQQEMVQFIRREAEDWLPAGYSTYAAKLYAIPWEQAMKRPIIKISKKEVKAP